jgi:hypothetical protein
VESQSAFRRVARPLDLSETPNLHALSHRPKEYRALAKVRYNIPLRTPQKQGSWTRFFSTLGNVTEL